MYPSNDRKKGSRMAALATPKGSSYIIKKDCTGKIVDSKNSAEVNARLLERAAIFEANNLRRGRK